MPRPDIRRNTLLDALRCVADQWDWRYPEPRANYDDTDGAERYGDDCATYRVASIALEALINMSDRKRPEPKYQYCDGSECNLLYEPHELREYRSRWYCHDCEPELFEEEEERATT